MATGERAGIWTTAKATVPELQAASRLARAEAMKESRMKTLRARTHGRSPVGGQLIANELLQRREMNAQDLIQTAIETELELGGDPKSCASLVIKTLTEEGWVIASVPKDSTGRDLEMFWRCKPLDDPTA